MALRPSQGAAPIMALLPSWGAAPIALLHQSWGAAPILPLHLSQGAAPPQGAAPTEPSPSPCSPPEAPETIELELRTGSADGLLLWHGAVSGVEGIAGEGTGVLTPLRVGVRVPPTPLTTLLPPQEPGEGGKAKDFIGLGLKDGHLVFR